MLHLREWRVYPDQFYHNIRVMDFKYVLALHIIFIVTWFSGLFYIVRLFIYQVEADQKTETEKNILIPQFQLMQKRLWYGITWPSAVLVLILGTWLLSYNFSGYLSQPWMHVKLTFVGGLYIYHMRCHMIFKQLATNSYTGTSLRLRIFNEVATVFLFAIVFLVVVKSSGSFVWGLLGLIILAAIIFAGIFVYKKQRENSESKD